MIADALRTGGTAATPTTTAPGHRAGSGPATAPGTEQETRRSARSGLIGLIGAAVSGLFGFLLAVVITRGYGPSGAGAFFAAIAVATIGAAVCTLGAETGLLWALPRRRPGAAGDAARLLTVALVPPSLLAVLVAGGGILAADRLAPELFGDSGAAAGPLLTITFAALPVVTLAVLLLAALRAVRSIGPYVAVQFFLLPIGRPLLVGAMLLAGGGLALGMTGWLLPAGAALLVCGTLVARSLGVGAGAVLRPDRCDWRTFWGFALPRAASAAIDAGNMWIGVLMTAALAGQAEAGVFGAVGRYVLAGQLAMQGLRVATAPQLSQLMGQGRSADAAAVHRQLTGWGIALSWPVYLLLAAFGPGFLQLFGAEFTAGAAAMSVLALAMLVNIAVGNVQSLLLMSGRSGLHLAATVAGLAVHILLGLLLIPRYGVLGAALAWGGGIVVENLTAAGAARRVVGRPLTDAAMLRTAAVVALAVGGAGGAAMVIAGRGVAGLLLVVALLAVGGTALAAVPRVRRRAWEVLGELIGRGTRAGRSGGGTGVRDGRA
jgi:O-antigen/teichoic acid export membrane protein